MSQPTTPADVRAIAARLVTGHGTTFAEEAGIELDDSPGPLWQLLVVTLLLSRRISADVAIATARELFAEGWTGPTALRASTWDQRVRALGRGGYRRYDFSTATRLDEDAAILLDRWDGDLRRLRDEAGGDPRGIAKALQEFVGIGPTGAGIFLREVQAVWPSVRPQVDALVLKGAEATGLPTDSAALAELVPADDLARLCAALVRAARDPAIAAEVSGART